MKRQIICLWLIVFFLFGMFPIIVKIPMVQASPDSVESSPSAFEDSQWGLSKYAYVSDDYRAFETIDAETVTYLNFSFEDDLPESITVDSVKVNAEGYVSLLFQEVWGKVSWDGGTTWSTTPQNFELPRGDLMETTKTIDVTGDIDWTRDKLTNDNFRVKLMYLDPEGEGCFTNKTYFVSWNQTLGTPFNSTHPEHAFLGARNPWILKNIEKAEMGDWVLVSSHDEGIRLEKIATIDKHFGNWTIFDIWSGETQVNYEDGGKNRQYVWQKHTRVTGNHPSLVFRDGAWIRVRADEILLTDQIRHLWHEEKDLKENEIVPLKEHSLVTGGIDRIDVENITDWVYDIRTDKQGDWVFMTTVNDEQMEILQMLSQKYGVNLGAYFDPPPQAAKWTGYVDYLTVTVTYSEIGGSAGAGTPSSRINALGAMIYSGVSFLWNGLFFLWTEKIYLPFLLLWTQGKITVEGCLASIFIVLMSYFISKNICNFLFKRKKR